ncbi:MAG TPA: class I SAM-dependent methyltransferase [Bacteroidia bacterium]|nr:class I SAM-dependent methyltransferase [Bacteroidia bacterium]HOZ90887.1 class I SAM-dependent methyltransferase [Bacteroidia bacterium]HQW16521.1 class I SAM-dependent methyltransferase [Bacteroidia bacterium]HQW47923.1 class I SAM-dependent methyltransferase [Bacteroidia bacterium]HQX70246.1 class I SAM-dependent methyltransferase [Bacteroidia bacterium]
MTKSYKEVAEYYDELWADLEKQSMAGVNSRHRVILNKLKKAGFNKNSTLLEIGCGVGTLSNFLATQVSSGSIDAVDISPASIEYAKKKYSEVKNLSFHVSDMTDFKINKKFDFILFPDVLEHIPVEAHDNIFKTISGLVHANSQVAINLPDPRSIRWLAKNKPELLQIIDQDIEANVLIDKMYSNGFFLFTMETYCLYFTMPDYGWFVFKVKKEYETTEKIAQSTVLLNGIKLRLRNLFS